MTHNGFPHGDPVPSKAVGAAYPAAEKPFLDSWRQHIGFFVDYTLGKATKNEAKRSLLDLDTETTAVLQNGLPALSLRLHFVSIVL